MTGPARRDAASARLAQLWRFLLVGGVATLTQYLALMVLVEFAGNGPISSSALGYLCGAGVSYGLNRSWTFNSSAPHRKAMPRFAAMVCLGFLLNDAAMFVLTKWAGVNYLFAQVGASAIVLLANYLMARSIVFAQDR